MVESGEMHDDLCEILTRISTKDEAKALLQDLCTYTEIDQMAQRLRAAKLLLEGKTYAQIIAETDISSATLSRVSKCIKHGGGGYLKLLKSDVT